MYFLYDLLKNLSYKEKLITIDYFHAYDSCKIRKTKVKYKGGLRNLTFRLRSHDAGTFWKRWKIGRIGLPFTRKRHIFCRQILITVDFQNGTLTDTFWKRHHVNTWKWWKQKIFRRFWNETGPLLRCRCISLTSKFCNEFYRQISHRFQIVPVSCER